MNTSMKTFDYDYSNINNLNKVMNTLMNTFEYDYSNFANFTDTSPQHILTAIDKFPKLAGESQIQHFKKRQEYATKLMARHNTNNPAHISAHFVEDFPYIITNN